MSHIYYEYGLNAPFIISDIFGTKCIEFFDGCILDWFSPKELRRIYEKKTPKLEMYIKISYEEETYMSLKELMEVHDVDNVLKYIVERGINLSNIKD